MDTPPSLLELDSQLSELIRVQTWIDELANVYRFGEETRFAIQLCMEEALANVILHGYCSEAGHPIAIRSWASEGDLYFAVEDKAPPFAPSAPDPQNGGALANLESIRRAETASACCIVLLDRSRTKDCRMAIA